jgi:glycosyltransferase involved in cell wall biosynthesis
MELLKRRGVTPKLRLIGRGADLDSCRQFCSSRNLDNVEFSGFLDWDEMLNSLRWAHVLLFPIRNTVANKSRCPFKVFQYAQAKRPIITCRVGEVPNFLGENAEYVECQPAEFANAIERTMSKPRLADIDYEIDSQTWEDRGRDFINAIS